MTQDELARRRQRADEEPLVVAKLPEGYRVHSPTGRTRPYLVSGTAEAPLCTCPDFENHAGDDPDWRCKHILAVFRTVDPFGDGHADDADSETREERAAIQAESGGDGPIKRNGITQMLIKRSVSPDGRIDALSIEFACSAHGESVTTLTDRAQEVLRIQSGIADAFLRRNGRTGGLEPPATRGRSPAPATSADARPIPAQLVRIGGSDGKWGRRLFLTIAADSRMLRLYGTPAQLAAHVARAGYPDLAEDLAEGLRLDVPCRIVTKGGADGGFLTVQRVLPAAASRDPAA